MSNNSGLLRRSLFLFNKKNKRKILFAASAQVALGILDLTAVAVVGILAALSVTGVKSTEPGNRVNTALNLLKIENQSFQTQVALLGIAAAVILILKSLLSAFLTRKILTFLSFCSAKISTNVVAKLFAQPLNIIQKRSFQENLYLCTTGVSSITNGIIGSYVNLITDLSLLIILAAALFVVNPLMAISSTLIFALIGIGIYFLQHNKAHRLGAAFAQKSVGGNEKFLEALGSYRETRVRNTQDNYISAISSNRYLLASIEAELSFLPNIGKYIIEVSTVISALTLCALQFAISDSLHAIATLSVFMAAGARIAPAVLRIQHSLLQIKSSSGAANPTLQLLDEIHYEEHKKSKIQVLDIEHNGFTQEVLVENVSFRYHGSQSNVLSNISFKINPGETVALVGPSGAGKSTLVDLILGIIRPTSGRVLLSKQDPAETVKNWPGAVAYVPQEIFIRDGSVLENVSMGYEISESDIPLIRNALDTAQLLDFFESKPEGLSASVGERGSKLSGGQKQRLGIARALLTRPGILVLDEATSALDGQSEAEISDSIGALKGKVTVIVIAHRLSTVRNVETILYLDNGRILASGSFEEIRHAIPDFNSQAKLMGL
jgi:ABC-type multidrug transport system fused ATPase/permease subunit